jgi:hypothetical protein
MKTILFKQASVFFFSLMISSLSFADDNNDGKKDTETSLSFVTSVAENKAIVKINNISAEKGAILKVKNWKEQTVYTENIKGQEFHNRKYDFTRLEPGKYTLALESEENSFTKNFTVGFDGIVRMYEAANFSNFKPIIFEKDEKINVCFENTTNRQLRVNILDIRGKVVYGEWVEQNAKYGRSFNLSKLGKGQYTVEVYSGSEYDYTEVVSVSKM